MLYQNKCVQRKWGYDPAGRKGKPISLDSNEKKDDSLVSSAEHSAGSSSHLTWCYCCPFAARPCLHPPLPPQSLKREKEWPCPLIPARELPKPGGGGGWCPLSLHECWDWTADGIDLGPLPFCSFRFISLEERVKRWSKENGKIFFHRFFFFLQTTTQPRQMFKMCYIISSSLQKIV